MPKDLKCNIYRLLYLGKRSTKTSLYLNYFFIILILINIILSILKTESSIFTKYEPIFNIIWFFSIIVFTIEYVLRIWTCTANPRYKDPIKGRIRYALTIYPIIDLIVLLSFYMPVIYPEFRFLWFLRLFRVLFLVEIGRYSRSFGILLAVFHEKRAEIILSLIFFMIILIISSTGMYYIESSAQPDTFSSIPAAMWWSVITLTTVGYGDMHPVTPLGKILGGITALIGILVLAFPTGVIASGYVDELQKRRRIAQKNNQIHENQKMKEYFCVHCGKKNILNDDSCEDND